MCGANNTSPRDCRSMFSIDQVPDKCRDFRSLITMLSALGNIPVSLAES
jgi:hypothetical protein